MPTVSRGLVRWLLYGGAVLEDFADRLNHVWTCSLLLVLGGVISWKHGVSSPISCWCPPGFTSEQVVHVETACWHSYYITYPADVEEYETNTGDERPLLMADFSDPLPWVSNSFHAVRASERRIATTKTTYYQWIPVIVCLQALLFKLPSITMYVLHGVSGITFGRIASLTEGFQYLTLPERETVAKQIARCLYNWCQNAVPPGIPWRGLTVVWFFVKCLYFVNVVFQLTFVDHFLRTRHPPFDNSTSYGDVIFDNLVDNNATTWRQSPAFPRLLLCDVDIRQIGNIQMYSFQCQLTANDFNEHVFIFIWVWLLFVAIVTGISFLAWILKTAVPFFRQRYIRRYLALAGDTDADNLSPLDVTRFTTLLGEDGVMVLKLVAANSSDLVTTDVVCSMWKLATQAAWPRRPPAALLQPPMPPHPRPWPNQPPGASAPTDPAQHEYDPGKIKA